MLDNYNDYISFAVLIYINIITLRFAIGTMFSRNNQSPLTKRFQVLLNYSENEDE